MPDDNSVKILFRFYSDILDEETTETLQAEAVDVEHGYYKLLGTPFYASKIAVGDIIWAEYNEGEGMLTYRTTVEHSGNSTVHTIILNDEYDIGAIIKVFEELGCISEKLNAKYFAINVPAAVNYFPVKQKLNELEKEKVIDYAESWLSEKHNYVSVFFR